MDVEAKLNNKLAIQHVEKEITPSTSKENREQEYQEDGDKVQEKNNIYIEVPGEDVMISEIFNSNRASTETLVLETCYNTAEDIQKELEHENEDIVLDSKKDDQNPSNLPKEFNDVSSDLENVDETNNQVKSKAEKSNNKKDAQIEISDSEEKSHDVDEIASEVAGKTDKKKFNTEEDSTKDTSGSIFSVNQESSSNNHEKNQEKPINIKISTPNSLNGTVDTQLPLNPEGLKKSVESNFSNNTIELSLSNTHKKRNKRVVSEGTINKPKKTKQQCVSDTDARRTLKKYNFKSETNKEKQQHEVSDKILEIDAHPKDQQEDIDKNEKESNISPDAQIIMHNTPLEIVTSRTQSEIQKTPEIENPCLKSVNLYEQQFCCTIYSESDGGQKEKNNEQQKKIATPQQKSEQHVVHSSSTTDVPSTIDVPSTKLTNLKVMRKERRDTALGRALGFINVPRNRKQSQSYTKRRSRSHHKTVYESSNSSDSIYESESDFVSPPRGRNNNKNRKYIRPVPHRIMSLGEDGQLFVVSGKKIYPVVKNGKPHKTFLSYSSDEQSHSESYWKLKYVEEKKKAAELAKQLEEFNKSKAIEKSVVAASTTTALEGLQKVASNNENEQISKKVTVPESTAVQVKDTEKVTIKIIRNDEQFQVEGPWSYMNPFLQQVVLTKETKTVNSDAGSNKCMEQRVSSSEVITLSGVSTPAKYAKNRLSEIEEQIYKDIEDIEKAEIDNNSNETSLTVRTSTTANGGNRGKRRYENKVSVSPKRAKVNEEKDKLDVPKRRSMRSSNITNAKSNANLETTTKRNGKRTSVKMVDSEIEDEKILYKLPSPPRVTYRPRRGRPRARYFIKNSRVYSYPEKLSFYSEDTQGNIDTDPSPIICMKRQKKLLSRRRYKRFHNICIPSITEDISSESNASILTAPVKTQTYTNSSVSSHIYRSDSYQLLMPKAKSMPNELKKIEEYLFNSNISSRSATGEVEGSYNLINSVNSKEQSFLLSLPTSPVLSIVENLSISKSFLSGINENDIDKQTDTVTLNNLMPEDLDISMPLMGSKYTVRKGNTDGVTVHYNLDDCVSDTSLRQKLENLIIQSANKNTNLINDSEVLPSAEKLPAKSKSKKISSTPRKRKSGRKSKSALNEPCIEEHVEFCSKSASRSDTPAIIVTPAEISLQDVNKKVTTRRPRVKKDIIKVKLPKVIRRCKSDTGTKTFMSSKDGERNGANDTESDIFLQGNENRELIHNHSDTCCKAHECLDSSVEFIQMSPNSIVTLDSDSVHVRNYGCSSELRNKSVDLEFINQDAQDGSDIFPDYVSRSRPCSAVANSLLTDDLSVVASNSPSWYLFDEDESTCFDENKEQNTNVGARLTDIFPIAYAVPNLSTITEASKDVEENSKNINY